MTHDTRVADWLEHSGASVKTGRFRCVINFLSLEAAVIDHQEVSVCSGVSQAVVSTTSDWIISYILYTLKANWICDKLIIVISKKLLLVTTQ